MHARDVIPLEGGLQAAFYGRHSTDQQDIETQISTARNFCDKYHCHFDETMQYHDLSVSAWKTPMQGRLGLIKLLDAIGNKKIDIVVAYSYSRLARDTREHAEIRLALEGIPVILCDTETVYNPPNPDILSQTMQDAVSKYEVEQTAIRTRDNTLYRVDHGYRIGGQVPYGYTYWEEAIIHKGREKKIRHYFPDLEHANEILEVYRRYARGEGFSSIAAALGWFQRDQKTPYKERVKSIIINPFYAGYVSMYKVRTKSRMSVEPFEKWRYSKSPFIEGIISFDQWFECFSIYEQKLERKLPPRHYNTSFLLTGLLWCEHPKAVREKGTAIEPEMSPMVGKNTTKRIKDACGKVIRTNGKREYVCECCNRRIDAVEIHHQVLQRFFRNYLARTPSYDVLLRTVILTSISDEISDYKRHIEESKRKQTVLEGQLTTATARLKELVEKEDNKTWSILIEEYRELLNDEIKQQTDLRERMKQRIKVLELVQKSPEYLIKSSYENVLHERALRTLLLSLVKQVCYTPDGKLVIDALVGEL